MGAQDGRWGNFVGGRYVDPKDGAFGQLIDPVSGEAFAAVPLSKPAEQYVNCLKCRHNTSINSGFKFIRVDLCHINPG